MRQYHDYIPIGDVELQNFAAKVFSHSQKSYERWGVPSPRELLEAPIGAFIEALGKFNDPNHGKVDTKNKNDAKASLKKALRTYIQGYIARNPLVTNEDRELMLLPLRDTTLTTHPAPTERPETEALPEGRGSHRVTAINPDTHNKNKPAFADGVAFARRVRKPSDPPSRADDMPSEYQTGTSRGFQYAESEYGMMVDYATAYENGNGKRGPWSNVASLLISG